ncbi:MAG: hypothetical protein ABWX74_03760 [Aeromicrobium sp.]
MPTDAPDEQAELERLRAEVARLSRPRPRGGWWRPPVVVLLVAIAVLMAPLSVVAIWARSEIGDTDRYVETVAPLASDPAVQDAITARVTDEIFSYVPVEELTSDALAAVQSPSLPPRVSLALTSLAQPITGAVRSFVESKIDGVVRSDAFADAWAEANRSAHAQLVAVLTGEGNESVDVDGDSVEVELAAVIAAVKSELVDAGFQVAERIPAVSVSFTIFESADLAKAQKAFGLLDTAATWLPLVGLAAALGAIALSRRRRRTVIAVASLIVASMLLLGLALNVFRPIYLDAIPASVLPGSAAAAIYDTVVFFIRQALRAVAVVGLAVAAVAWFTSPAGSGASARATARRGMTSIRHGLSSAGVRTGAVGRFAADHRRPLHLAVAIVGLGVYLAQDHPTGLSTAILLLLMLVVVVVIELLQPPEDERGVTA